MGSQNSPDGDLACCGQIHLQSFVPEGLDWPRQGGKKVVGGYEGGLGPRWNFQDQQEELIVIRLR